MKACTTVQIGFGIMALAVHTFAVADELPTFTGGEIVVTGARMPQKQSDTLRAVSVITAQDIAESGQHTLAEVLQQFAGVEISTSGGFGQSSAVFMRGANSDHTLVLVDGMRIGSATLGTTALENIPLNQIDRIEIVSGPVSGLYGSDAIGGVIQIFTKSGKYSPGLSVSAGYGSYDTRSLSTAYSSKFRDTEVTLSAGYFDTDSFSATKPTVPFGQFNPDNDGYRNSNFSGKITHKLSGENDLGATGFYSRGSAHFDSGPTSDDVTHQTLSAYSVYSKNQISSTWQSLIRVGTGRDDSTSGGAFPGQFQTDQDQATWQNTFTFQNGTLIAGAEYVGQRVSSTTDFPITKRHIASAFAGFRGDYGDHAVEANLRRDDNSQFGKPTTGSVAYGYRLTPEAQVEGRIRDGISRPDIQRSLFPWIRQSQPGPRAISEPRGRGKLRNRIPALGCDLL